MPGPANTSPIQLDISARTVVVLCTEHPYWRAIRFTKDEAMTCAAAHERDHHPGDQRIRDSLRKTRRRAAPDATPALTAVVAPRV